MTAFTFRCPDTGQIVQGFAAEDETTVGGQYVAIECLACRRLHLVNPTTGKTLRERKTN
jgi:hypothetical protein